MFRLYLQITDIELRKKYEKSIILYMQSNDCGFDLYIPKKIRFYPVVRMVTIDHEIKCMVINNNKTQHSYYLYPRSSISNTHLRMANSVGIIDAGYRGNIIAKCDNVECDVLHMCGVVYHEINQYTRLFQLCTPDLSKFTSIEIVDSLPDSDCTIIRGSGGFGSTGK